MQCMYHDVCVFKIKLRSKDVCIIAQKRPYRSLSISDYMSMKKYRSTYIMFCAGMQVINYFSIYFACILEVFILPLFSQVWNSRLTVFSQYCTDVAPWSSGLYCFQYMLLAFLGYFEGVLFIIGFKQLVFNVPWYNLFICLVLQVCCVFVFIKFVLFYPAE